MSEKNAKLTCPKCGKEFVTECCEFIDVRTNPELKEALLSGELFIHKCPGCGQDIVVLNTLVYHDLDKKAEIYFVPDNSVEEVAWIMKKSMSDVIEHSGMDHFVGIKNRIVTFPLELHEKILIFDCGLDDRIIELLKVALLDSVIEAEPDAKIDYIVFTKDPEHGLVFKCLCGNNVVCSAPFENRHYQYMYNEMIEKVVANPAENFVYDFSWASSILG